MNQPSILLTIDVEDWFQVENLRTWFPTHTWDNQELRVEKNTNKILDLLDSIALPSFNSTNPKATFFILGWIAKRFPGLVRKIQNRGHEVASHGYSHLMCNQLEVKNLKQDLIRSKKTIEDITGAEVKGYRAPNFSINNVALKLVQNCGYKYDSSFNNFSRHGRYGTINIDGKRKLGMAIIINNDFAELPVSNLSVGKQVLPWGGGGYFRFFPISIFKFGVKHILKQSNTYMFYIHPWEIDQGQPRIKEARGLKGWRHYLNLDKTCSRLGTLITSFNHCKFPTCSKYIDQFGNQGT